MIKSDILSTLADDYSSDYVIERNFPLLLHTES